MPNIRAMVFDLDRTLLRSDRTVSTYTQSILARCRETGIYSIIATARPPRSIGVYEEMIRPDASVTMNGASLRMGGQEMRSVSIAAEEVKRLISSIDRLLPGRTWSLEAQSGLHANFDTTSVWEGPAAPVVTVDTVPNEPAYKVLIGLKGSGDADIMRSILPKNTYLEIAEGTLGMVIHSRATKLQGVLTALQALSVRPEDAAAFGDDLADIGMLKSCGFGVAVSNALPEVKSAADYLTGSNDEDGVAKWLEAYAGI